MKRIPCLILLVLAIVAPARAESTKIVAVSTCMTRIVYEQPMNEQFLTELANQSNVAGELSRAILERPWLESDASVRFKRSHEDATGSYFYVTLYYGLADEHEAVDSEKADAFLRAVLARLNEVLTENYKQFVVQQHEQVEEAGKRAELAAEQLLDLQTRRVDLAKQSDGELLSYHEALEAQRRAVEQLRDIQTDAIVMTETRDALARRIAEIADEASSRAESDEVIQRLQELLALKEQSMEQVVRLAENGRAPAADVSAARAEVLQTQIEIARRREALSQEQAGDRLAKLNARLDDLLIEATRLEAMQNVAQERLTEMRERDLVGLAEQLEQLEMKIQSGRETLHRRERILEEFTEQMNALKAPRIDVIE